MAKKTNLEVPGLGVEFEKALAEAGLAEIFQKIVDRPDMGIDVLSSGLPRLDAIIHAGKLGIPIGRDIEIYSRDPEVGKTSLALQIGSHWQKLGKKVAIVDVEDTITSDYLVELGYNIEGNAEMYPPYVAKAFDDQGTVRSAEEIIDNIGIISNLVDLVIVDSIGALAKQADLDKQPGDASMAGIAKTMWEYVRRYGHTKATKIWINQALPQIGVFSPAGIKYKTSGGQALQFASSVKLELRLVEKLKGPKPEEEVYGVVIDAHTAKNKISPPYRHVKLTYLNGEGFSPIWDLFEAALAAKIIQKSGSWFNFNEERLGQGMLNAYQLVKSNETIREKIQEALEAKNNVNTM
jgi:recombination protein RecA